MHATLCFGLQKVAQNTASQNLLKATVRSEIERLLQQGIGEKDLTSQVQQALDHPHSVIELRSGKQVQTVLPDMPLREVLPPKTGAFEITISRPHAGG